MISLYAESKCYGSHGQYIAHITGRDAKYTYAREFVGRKSDRSTEAFVDQPGLYEIGDIDKKGRKDPGYCYIYARTPDTPPLSAKADPNFGRLSMSESDVMTVTRRLDAGESLTDIIAVAPNAEGNSYEYSIRTPGEAKKAAIAVTLDTATEACWQVLQALPERDAKKVLAALKLRISPKPPAAEALAPTEAEIPVAPAAEI